MVREPERQQRSWHQHDKASDKGGKAVGHPSAHPSVFCGLVRLSIYLGLCHRSTSQRATDWVTHTLNWIYRIAGLLTSSLSPSVNRLLAQKGVLSAPGTAAHSTLPNLGFWHMAEPCINIMTCRLFCAVSSPDRRPDTSQLLSIETGSWSPLNELPYHFSSEQQGLPRTNTSQVSAACRAYTRGVLSERGVRDMMRVTLLTKDIPQMSDRTRMWPFSPPRLHSVMHILTLMG
ncbi:hypothetical protein QBC38DRAFT_106428 [Podospora fimiseda]|uniref:Uncharacterized protein n=1 Tax=Podospora fimiseda TaxID=252190 RepID=A0AAN7BU65_9PEZI|nr:hypothetical protein QBC38DRAFT_106428 [Podospora fimiseda]